MILVIMGMEVHPFDRLARAVDELQLGGAMHEDFFVQLGSCTYVPSHAQHVRFLPFGDLCEKVRLASVVVTHAGAGSTLTCIQHGKHPILVPRSSKLGEHVDDHQQQFTIKFGNAGLGTPVLDVAELGATIVRIRDLPGQRVPKGGDAELAAWLEQYWRSLAK